MEVISVAQFHALLNAGNKVVQREDLHRELFHTSFSNVFTSDLFDGTMINTSLRPDFTVMQATFKIHNDVKLELESLEPLVGFCFCLGGSTYIGRWRDGMSDEVAGLEITAGTGYMYATPDSIGYQIFRKGETYSAVYIHLSFASFEDLMGDALKDLPTELTTPLSDPGASFIRKIRLSRQVIQLCKQLREVPFTGKSKNFFIEAKTIELIAHQVDDLYHLNKRKYGDSLNLTTREEEIIEECHSILEKEYYDPPSILKLARDNGISDYRLKNGFKNRYGMTPYRFILMQRMLKAKSLLSDGKLNVTEVSQAVGFSSLGSFSNAFVETFGHRPSSLKSSFSPKD